MSMNLMIEAYKNQNDYHRFELIQTPTETTIWTLKQKDPFLAYEDLAYNIAVDYDFLEKHISEMKEWIIAKKGEGYKISMVMI